MAGISPDYLEVEAQLQGILINFSLANVTPLPDGTLSFTYRLVVKLVEDCLTKCHQGLITSEHFEDLQNNIRTILQQAEERSQSGDLASMKQLAQQILCVVERLAHSFVHPETSKGDDKEGQNMDAEIPDPSLG